MRERVSQFFARLLGRESEHESELDDITERDIAPPVMLIAAATRAAAASSGELLMTALARIEGAVLETDENVPTMDIDPNQQAVLVRVAHEAVANAQRHARATNVTITLSASDADASHVRLDVRDDGIGFDPALATIDAAKKREARKGGVGLLSMKSRVLRAQGSIDIESNDGTGGTIVHVEIPTRRGRVFPPPPSSSSSLLSFATPPAQPPPPPPSSR